MERLDLTLLCHGHRAAPTSTGRPASFTRAAALSTSDRRIPIPSSEPRTASLARSGWGISPQTLPRALSTPAIARMDLRVRHAVVAVRGGAVGADIPEDDLPVAFERVQRRVIGVVAALSVGDRHAQRPQLADRVGEGRVEPHGPDRHVTPQEAQRSVAQQRPWHEPGLGEHLEAVADPEDEASLVREGGH